ncbi:MAG: 16S rRNA (adenine(1518)-N(6)/adenine(1519)-N(6))-dimethyltransferase RsmA [Gammaproteobacteria bacterium]
MRQRTRKRFGQHFLHDPAVIARIVDAIDPQPGECVVEIGPGLGAITRPLIDRAGRVIAIEIDRDLAGTLSEDFDADNELIIHNCNALTFDFLSVRCDAKLRITGNLPYNISTPLLFRLTEFRDQIEDMHFMLQKEVVDRMVAHPGSKAYGRLTVMLAPYLQMERLFTIGAGAFKPPPKVNSAFVRLRPHSVPPFRIDDEGCFSAIVAEAFSHRRKTMRNALRRYFDEADLVAAHIVPGVRPEAVSPEAFAALARQLAARGKIA